MHMEWLWGLIGGLMIGTAGGLYLLGNGRIMGVSGILGGLIDGSERRHWQERLCFLAGLTGIPALFVLASDAPAQTNITSSFGLILTAGLLVGLGTRIGGGCTSGHGVCGMSRLSIRSIVATCLFMASGVVTVAVFRLVGL